MYIQYLNQIHVNTNTLIRHSENKRLAALDDMSLLVVHHTRPEKQRGAAVVLHILTAASRSRLTLGSILLCTRPLLLPLLYDVVMLP